MIGDEFLTKLSICNSSSRQIQNEQLPTPPFWHFQSKDSFYHARSPTPLNARYSIIRKDVSTSTMKLDYPSWGHLPGKLDENEKRRVQLNRSGELNRLPKRREESSPKRSPNSNSSYHAPFNCTFHSPGGNSPQSSPQRPTTGANFDLAPIQASSPARMATPLRNFSPLRVAHHHSSDLF